MSMRSTLGAGRTAHVGLPGLAQRTVRHWNRTGFLWQLVAAFVLAVTWEALGRALDFIFLPPLSQVLKSLWQIVVDGTIASQLVQSLVALVVGLIVSIVSGILIGTLMGVSERARHALDIYVNAMLSAPMVAFVPLFILLFGLGFETRVVVVIIFSLFVIIVNAEAATRAVDPTLIEMSRSFGAGSRVELLKVRLPMAYPLLRAGLSTGVSRGVDGLITGEVLLASVGLGGLVSQYGSAFTMSRLYAVVFVIVALALAAVRVTDWLTRLLFGVRR